MNRRQFFKSMVGVGVGVIAAPLVVECKTLPIKLLPSQKRTYQPIKLRPEQKRICKKLVFPGTGWGKTWVNYYADHDWNTGPDPEFAKLNMAIRRMKFQLPIRTTG